MKGIIMTTTIASHTSAFPANGISLMTAEEFFRQHQNNRVELVKGIVKEMPIPGGEHGYIVSEMNGYLREFVKANDLGRTMTADTFIRIPGNPETVRGADVLFLSYNRWPKENKIPGGMLEVPPDLVVEVRSPSDTWTDLYGKVGDYLRAGVTVVIVVDPMRKAVGVYRLNIDEQADFGIEQELVVPDVLPGFSLAVRKLFE
jgi:Uma2 family endonuclease